MVSDDKENEANWTEISTTYEGSFLELKNVVTDTIVSACQWSRSMAGLATTGAIGNNQQLKNEYEVAMKPVRRTRSRILSKLF